MMVFTPRVYQVHNHHVPPVRPIVLTVPYQFLVGMFASFGSFLYGYDLGVIGGCVAASAFRQTFNNPSPNETFVTSHYILYSITDRCPGVLLSPSSQAEASSARSSLGLLRIGWDGD